MDSANSRSRISLAFSAVAAAAALAACSPSRWHEVSRKSAPNTGDRIAEQQISPIAAPTQPGSFACVYSDRVQARAVTAPAGPRPPACALDRNSRLKVVSLSGAETIAEFAQAGARGRSTCPARFSVQSMYLKPCDDADASSAPGSAERYFAVLNVATEMLRVYERCAAGDACRGHRLAHQVPMLAGPNVEGRRTLLGEYRIESWHQFYADARDDYPSYWRSGYPALPHPRAGLADWLSSALLPGGAGKQRGNFGWFTAKLTPDADGQWLQGTWGWAEDGDRFIRLAKERAALDPADPRTDLQTHGCTRVDNLSILFLRSQLPVGTVVARIYAKEALRNPQRPRPTAAETFAWTLESDASFREAAQTSAAQAGAAPTLSGSYPLNGVATAVPGDKYGATDAKMRGVFYVDEGRVEGYQHPQGLGVGGYGDRIVPDMMVAPVAAPGRTRLTEARR